MKTQLFEKTKQTTKNLTTYTVDQIKWVFTIVVRGLILLIIVGLLFYILQQTALKQKLSKIYSVKIDPQSIENESKPTNDPYIHEDESIDSIISMLKKLKRLEE